MGRGCALSWLLSLASASFSLSTIRRFISGYNSQLRGCSSLQCIWRITRAGWKMGSVRMLDYELPWLSVKLAYKESVPFGQIHKLSAECSIIFERYSFEKGPSRRSNWSRGTALHEL